MKKFLLKSLTTSLFIVIICTMNSFAQPCSDAGTASATSDSLCFGDTTTLVLTGYIGAIQWQSFDGSMWIDETNPGATTDAYKVSLFSTTDFRAVVTAAGCLPDTSNTITINMSVVPPATTGDTRCGYGSVTLTSQTPGLIRWFDVPTGGVALDTGATFTTNVGNTTTFYAASVTNGGTGVTPMPNQAGTFGSNARGYWFTAPTDFTITGVFVPTGNGANQNIAVIKFDNNQPPPFFATTTNAFTTLFLTQNDPSTGVIPVSLSVQAGDVIGVLATRGNSPGSETNSYAPSPNTTVIDGQTVTLTRMGMQLPLSTNVPQDIWQEAGGSISRLELYYDIGCESARTPTIATVNPSTIATISATDSALCAGQSAILDVNSTSTTYTYNWSPAAGLNTTTGTTVTATPTVPTYYTVVATDSVCGYIDSLFIDVGPASAAGTATSSTDTICAGNEATLTLTGSVGNVQWQSFNGTSWVDETNPGNDSTAYTVSPTQDLDYRAVVTSGGCDPDTSITLSIAVLTITDPILADTSLCGSGNVDLTAIGQGNFNWYDDSTSIAPFFTGATYSYNATASDTFWVEAFGGADYDIGALNPGIGSQNNSTSNDFGMAFDVAAQCVIESVKVFPQTAGPVTINLRQVQNGAIISSFSTTVQAFIGQDLPINFTVSPGTNYRLELATGSVVCTRNTTGANYPYQVSNGPLEITGYLSPNFNTGGAYYYFYDWQVSEGCKSSRVPVVVTVNQFPPTPTIGQLGNTLVSSSATGNQWLLNGTIIPGATGQSYTPTQIGTYVVAVTENGCTSLSPPFPVVTIGLTEIDGIEFTLFPNPVSDVLNITTLSPITFDAALNIYDVAGRSVHPATTLQSGTLVNTRIDVSSFTPGVYIAEVRSDSGTTRIKFQILK